MKRGQEFADVWRRRFDEAAQSGTTTINWCRQNGFSVNQYYYWNRRLRELAAEAGVSAGPVGPSGSVGISADRTDEHGPGGALSSQWLRVEAAAAPAMPQSDFLTVRVCSAEIDVHIGFNAALLRSVVQALGADPC